MTLGETIRKMRRAREITQEDLAELLHITPQAVSRWEYDAVDYNNGYKYRIDKVPFKGEAVMAAQTNSPEDYRDGLAKTLAEERWDFVRDTPEFAEILAIIAK